MTTGEKLLLARKAANLTQKALGLRMGRSRDTVRRWEQNRTSPKAEEIEQLAKVLNTSASYFLSTDNNLQRKDPSPKQLAQRIRALRKEAPVSEVAVIAGITTEEWVAVEKGDTTPPLATLEKMAKACGSSVADLLAPEIMLIGEGTRDLIHEKGSSERRFSEDPVWIDEVTLRPCAGEGNGYHEVVWEVESRFPMSPTDLIGYSWRCGKLRIVRIDGHSMEPHFSDGERILFAEGEVGSGDIAIVCWDGRLFIRGYIVDRDGSIRLKAYNPEFPEIIIHPEDDRLCVLGRVLGSVGRFRPARGFWG